MEILKIIGVTLIIVIPTIIICAFLSGKSKGFIEKISGNDKSKR